MRDLQRKLDHDAKLQQFFGTKGNRRVNVELEMREANRKLMQQELVDKQLNDLESILDDIKVGVFYFLYFKTYLAIQAIFFLSNHLRKHDARKVSCQNR